MPIKPIPTNVSVAGAENVVSVVGLFVSAVVGWRKFNLFGGDFNMFIAPAVVWSSPSLTIIVDWALELAIATTITV